MKYVNDNINDDNYLTISTYSLDKQTTNTINFYGDVKKQITSLPQIESKGSSQNGWFNHPIYRPTYYNFCSAITKKNMDKLNGFDERYADGISFDDNEFLLRVRRLGLNVLCISEVCVIHQYHPSYFYSNPKLSELHSRNKKLYHDFSLKENIVKVNI
jgi:GT2 family glycosyltransferase